MSSALGQMRRQMVDVVRRGLERMSRPFRILGGPGEYMARRDCAASLDPSTCLDVAALRSDGYLRTSLPGTLSGPLLADCREWVARNENFTKSQKYKSFFRQLLPEEALTLEGVYVRVALEETILRTVACYLGFAPFLEEVSLYLSLPEEDPPKLSQLWHRDRSDRSIIKHFVYVEDVELDNGPFTLIPARESGRVPGFLPHYLTDDQVSRYVPLPNAVQIMGKAGTGFLVDSATCYHQGSRCRKPRLAYVAYYSSGFGYRGRDRQWDSRLASNASLSRLQLFALGLPGGRF